jgi:mannose-6-phosphate isomerase-like protein (cupin superfamily)
MNKTHFHINEIGWQNFADKEWSKLRWKELLNRKQGDSKEFVFGLAELSAGERLPLHTHSQAETDFILSGNARVRLGIRSVELGPASAVYFLGKKPHSIETLGSEPLRYIFTYACEKLGHTLNWELADERIAALVNIRNMDKSRWAISEEFEEWLPWEPSKGFKMRYKILFDQEHGNCQEMVWGTCELDPGVHYTLHYHDQPEIYYVIVGRGIVYAGDSKVEVSSGMAVYLPGQVVHGADCFGEEPLHMCWILGAETVGQNVNWTPVEDIYTEVRVSK